MRHYVPLYFGHFWLQYFPLISNRFREILIKEYDSKSV